MPLHVYRKSVCQLVNNEYRNYRVMHDFHNYTNLPFSDDKNVNLCDLVHLVLFMRASFSCFYLTFLFQGHYYFRNYTVDTSLLFKNTPPGRYRAQGFVYRKNEKEIVRMVEIQSVFT